MFVVMQFHRPASLLAYAGKCRAKAVVVLEPLSSNLLILLIDGVAGAVVGIIGTVTPAARLLVPFENS